MTHIQSDRPDNQDGDRLIPAVCTDPNCTIPRKPGWPMHGPHDFRAARKSNTSTIGDQSKLGRDALAEQVAAVEELHSKVHAGVLGRDWCSHCRDRTGGLVEWPCPTIAAQSDAGGRHE